MIKLSTISTRAPEQLVKKEIRKQTKYLAQQIAVWQEKLYSEKKQSLLIVFQGMDASGKDSSTAAAFERCTPVGVVAHSFKKPTEEEFAHDFLWRAHKLAPQKGIIKIFLRSHYEDILIQRVHNWIDKKKVTLRMNAINAFEELLQFDNNTTVLKFYLHLSKEDQEKELQERIDIPENNWKHNSNDWEERKMWEEYRVAYEYAINQSSIPWTVIPADQAWYRKYLVTKNILETLQKMNPEFPEASL